MKTRDNISVNWELIEKRYQEEWLKDYPEIT